MTDKIETVTMQNDMAKFRQSTTYLENRIQIKISDDRHLEQPESSNAKRQQTGEIINKTSEDRLKERSLSL
jgi:hypothetical protein